MTSELEELQNIAVSILRTDKITVILDNTLETACTDYKNIFITTNLVPPELLKYNRVVSRLLDGEVAHEAAHILKTAPLRIQLEKWMERQGNNQLAKYVFNVIEDKRVNHYIFLSYRHDYAYRLRLLDDVTNRLWIDTLKAKIAKKRNVYAYTMKPESFFIESMLISIAGMMSHDAEVEKYFDFNPEQKTFIQKTKNILDEACFAQMVMSVVNLHQQLYDLWHKQIYKTYDDTKENTPASMGGNLKLESGQLSKKAMAQKEKALKEAEQKLEEELKKENKQKEDLQQGMGAGSGSGLNIPTPEPNEKEYQHLAQRNMEHIQKLLNLLKRLAMPIMKNERFTSEGRFMNEVLGKAYASSMRRNIREIYSKKTITLEKAEACIGLLVDLSGSVNLEDAKDSLTVIAEVCGQWLRDEDFAIMVFGSAYQKIKAYVEPYHTTKLRIGGIDDMGGTVLYEPLNEMFQMMKAQRNNRAEILMIVSDFSVMEREKCQKLIKTIEESGINVIGLGINSTTEEYIRYFCQRAKYIGNIRELPEAVFELYQEVAF